MDRVPAQRWRLVFRRVSSAPPLPQREAAAAWETALIASGLPFVTVDEDRRRPKIGFGAPPGPGMAVERDLVDLWLEERMPIARVRDALTASMPPGHALVDLHDVWLGEPALSGRVVASDVEAALRTGASVDELRDAARAMLAATTLPRERAKGDRTVSYDLRPFLLRLEVLEGEAGAAAEDAAGRDAVAAMRLAHDPEKGIGRPEEVVAELASRAGRPVETVAVVRVRLVLPDDEPVRREQRPVEPPRRAFTIPRRPDSRAATR